MFLVNSRHRRFPATRLGFNRKGLHLTRAPLLPKLRGQFAEFLSQGCPTRLGRLLPAHLCRFAVRSPELQRPRGYFLAAWSELLPESRSSRLLTPPHPPNRDLPRSIIGLKVWRANHTAPEPFPSASPLDLHPGGGRILTPLPIPYAFRPQVRGRLTLGGRPFPRKPWAYGGRDSHPPYRYSCPDSLLQNLQQPLRATFIGNWSAPLPLKGAKPFSPQLRRLA